jgi:hypothetical protein
MIYLNCGYYAGNDWNRFESAPDWTIYAFEPNPELEVPDFVIRKAVWTEETEVDFAIGGRNDAASIKGTSGHSDPKMIKVQTIDFSKFVAELPDEPIICTMDCEGSEFPILEKMLKDGTIKKITLLDIEFHHRIMADYDSDDAHDLLNRIRKEGVLVCLRIPLQ